MSVDVTIDDLLDQFGWDVAGDATVEGAAQRIPIKVESGEDALLYLYADEQTALRAGAAHDKAGEQLFAVPERLASGPRWLVVQHPLGQPLVDVIDTLQSSAKLAVLESLGQVLRKLHQLPCDPFCGDIAPEDGGAERWLTFSGYVAHHLEWFSENMRRRSFSDSDAEALTTAIGDLRHELSAFHPRNPACLCHGKLATEHIWVDDACREVVGLTGFECAAQAPREADIAYLLWITNIGEDERYVRAFYQGYGAARTMDVQRRERFYRRLVAFQALFDGKGTVTASVERLIALTSSSALL